MTNARWPKTLLMIGMWLLVTALVAWYVGGKSASIETRESVSAPLPPVSAQERGLVSLSAQTIEPVISANGLVVFDEDDDRWLLVAAVPTADLAYRLLDPPIGVRALIQGGPVGFDCTWDGLQTADGVRSAISAQQMDASQGELVNMRCIIPDDVRVIAGMRGTMVLRLSAPEEGLALPRTAVFGDAEQGQVVVVHADGSTEVRSVQLGVSDDRWIVIESGLEEGESVLEAPTQYDLRQAAP